MENAKNFTPYPAVISKHRNPHDIKILMTLYSGTNGEITAVMEYIYQHFVLKATNREAADIFKEFSVKEMHHMELLADAICALGGDPKFFNHNIDRFWCANILSCDKRLGNIIMRNLTAERCGYAAYTAASEKVSNSTVAALLKRIAEDEKEHIIILNDLFDCCCKSR